MPSPTGDIFDDNPNKFTTYLHRLAGSHEIKVNVLLLDHCYARPWNWKPENVYAKPVKKLFFPKAQNVSRTQDETTEIDVVLDDEVQTKQENMGEEAIPIDLARPRHLMDEFQRLAAFAKPEETEDWEEKIDKTWWTSIQTGTFAKVLRILASERLARLVRTGTCDEPIFRRTSIDTAARRFRETLASTGWDIRVAQWLHLLLFEHLPQEYLGIYLDILQTLRSKIPLLVDKIIAAQPTLNGRSGPITWETLGTLLKRSWDPVASTLNANKPNKLPGNPILVIAPCRSGATISSRQHKWISLFGTLGMVVNVPVHLGLAASKMTMMACIDQLVQATRIKIQDVRGDCPGRPIILVGFNSGAALACQVAQLEHVTAVICLGFPFLTAEGKRGTPDDTLLDIRCPVMFIVGQNAALVRPEDLENLREKMMVETNLVVVGAADDQLRITTSKKVSDGITQSMVDRCILDEIGDFVGSILLQPHPLPLRSAAPVAGGVIMSHLDSKMKKEMERRKNSTSSSVESEPNSPCAKKSRPNTPVSTMLASNAFSSINSSMNKPPMYQVAQQSPSTPVVQASIKRKPRATGNYRTSHTDNCATAKFPPQSTSTNNGSSGITLNIGSFASLAPVGPISLTPSHANCSAGNVTHQAKIPIQTKASQMNVSKMAKAMPPVSGVHNQGKIRTVVPAANRAPKATQNIYKPMNIAEEKAESRNLNQVRMSTSVTSNAISSQRLAGNSSLSALLQSGKPGMVVTSGTPMGKTSVTSNVLIPSSGSTSTTATASKVANVARGENHMCSSERIVEMHLKKSSQQASKGNVPCKKQAYPLKSSEEAETTRIQRSYTSTSMVVSGTQGSLNVTSKQPKTLTKVTVANLPKQQVTTTATKQCLESELPDYDLGNILDIPIIFAKDDENLSNIEKEMSGFQALPAVTEKSVAGPMKTTKMVLISNKQDKRPMVQAIVRQNAMQTTGHQQQHLIVQSRDAQKSNSVTTIARAVAHPRTTTKIILKRNPAAGAVRKDGSGSEQVVLTKKPRITSSQIFTVNGGQEFLRYQNEPLEIEDAIKTNIIERKIPILNSAQVGTMDAVDGGDDFLELNQYSGFESERQ